MQQVTKAEIANVRDVITRLAQLGEGTTLMELNKFLIGASRNASRRATWNFTTGQSVKWKSRRSGGAYKYGTIVQIKQKNVLVQETGTSAFSPRWNVPAALLEMV